MAAAALAFLAGCHGAAGQASGITMESEVLPQPARVGPASVGVKLSGVDKRPVTGARIELEGDTSHPGMAPVFGEARETEPGYYRGRLEFSMAGDWVVLLHVTLANGTVLQRQVEVEGVRSH
jgi:hypothetical protein